MTVAREWNMKLIGRQSELDYLNRALESTMTGQGGTLLVSGEPGIGKSRLMEDFAQGIRDCVTVLSGAAAQDMSRPFLVFSKALGHVLGPERFEETNFTSFAEVFAVNRAGLLVAQASAEEGGLDADIFAGMLSAVQDFVRDSFDSAGEQKAGLGRLEYGDMKILLEHGDQMFIAAVLRGPEHPDMKPMLKRRLSALEADHGATLESWTGKMEDMEPVQSAVAGLTESQFLVRRELEDVRLEAERVRIADTALQGLKGLAEQRPVLLLLEDLHWADDSSLFIFEYLARNIHGSRILMVGTTRPGEAPHLEEALETMLQEGLLHEMRLEKLGSGSVGDIIADRFPNNVFPQSFVDALSERCDGNPLFVQETLWQMESEGNVISTDGGYELASEDYGIPATVEDMVHRRLDSLEPDAMALAEYASCIGREFGRELLLSMRTLADPSASLEKLRSAGIIHIDDGDARFSHALFQDVTYQSISERWRQAYHKSIGEHFEALHANKLNEVMYELARHFSKSLEHSKGYEYCVRAGEKAENAYAPEQAIEFYTQAFYLVPKAKGDEAELLERLGDVHALNSDMKAAVEWFGSAIEKQEDDQHRAELHRKLAECYIKMGESQKGREECELGLGILKDDSREKARLLMTMGFSYNKVSDYKVSDEYFNQGLAMAEELGLEKEKGDGCHNLGTNAWYKGDYDVAIQYLERAVEIRERSGKLNDLGGSLMNLGTVYHYKGDLDRALEFKERSLELYRKANDKYGIGAALNNVGIVHYDRGDLDRCLEMWSEALEIRRSIADPHGLATTLHNIASIHHERGEFDNALENYERALEINRRLDSKNGITYDLCSMAETFNTMGKAGESRERANMALELSIEMGAKAEEGWARRLLGSSYRLDGDLMKAEEYLDQAFAIFTETGEAEEVAKTHMDYGNLYKAMGKPGDARKAFEKALEMFEEMGIRAGAERIRKELEEVEEP